VVDFVLGQAALTDQLAGDYFEGHVVTSQKIMQ